jgi:hypothetical protein
MKKSNPVPGATTEGAISAMSLIAITAGTVSAALVIMFIGFFMTVVSIGSSTGSDMHAEQLTSPLLASRVLAVDAVSKQALRTGPQAHKAEKGHFMDALLREDMHRPTAAAAEGQGQPAAKVTRIFANPMSMPFVPAKSRVTRV